MHIETMRTESNANTHLVAAWSSASFNSMQARQRIVPNGRDKPKRLRKEGNEIHFYISVRNETEIHNHVSVRFPQKADGPFPPFRGSVCLGMEIARGRWNNRPVRDRRRRIMRRNICLNFEWELEQTRFLLRLEEAGFLGVFPERCSSGLFATKTTGLSIVVRPLSWVFLSMCYRLGKSILIAQKIKIFVQREFCR